MVMAGGWLGDPLDTFAVVAIEHMRQRLGGGGSSNRRHLGEATSIVLAKQKAWTLATDDRDAGRLARSEGVAVVTTPMILRACSGSGAISPEDASEFLRNLVERYRRRLPILPVDWFQ
jgi:predicted nucleic acid-binding protein